MVTSPYVAVIFLNKNATCQVLRTCQVLIGLMIYAPAGSEDPSDPSRC